MDERVEVVLDPEEECPLGAGMTVLGDPCFEGSSAEGLVDFDGLDDIIDVEGSEEEVLMRRQLH